MQWTFSRIDNRAFRRRPNGNSVAIQTDLTIPPLVNAKVNNNNVTFTEQMNEHIVETCTKNSIETLEKSNATYNNRNGSNTYRIPKKNPFARNIHSIDESKNSVSVCNSEKLEISHMISNDQQKRYHLPKKNPHARRLDVHEEKPDVIERTRVRYGNDVEKFRSSRRDDDRDKHKRSTSATNRDRKKSYSSDDQRRHRHNSRSRRKHSRGRSSSDERDRLVQCDKTKIFIKYSIPEIQNDCALIRDQIVIDPDRHLSMTKSIDSQRIRKKIVQNLEKMIKLKMRHRNITQFLA